MIMNYSFAPTNVGALRLVRATSGSRFRSFKVWINGRAVGKIRNGATLDLPLALGSNSIQVGFDWVTSPVVHVWVTPGQIVWLECGCSHSGWMNLLLPEVSIISSITNPNEWLYLRGYGAPR
jgi:hypothetical protein